MIESRSAVLRVVALLLAGLLAACQTGSTATHGTDSAISVGASDLGGVVTSANGPEAGVWVIAETRDLPTPYAKIVVTDDRGRYVMPDLPKATYAVWVRGYGLADTTKVQAAPGSTLNLTARVQTDRAAAAQTYPAIYWYSMLSVPEAKEFRVGRVAHQNEWLNVVKNAGCNACHSMGTPGMRTVPKALGEFKTSAEAWQRRIQS